MGFEDFKSLNRGTAADKILSDKTFNIAKYPKDDGYQHGLDSLVYKFFLIKNLQVEQLKLTKN